jgi:hypothetical protein
VIAHGDPDGGIPHHHRGHHTIGCRVDDRDSVVTRRTSDTTSRHIGKFPVRGDRYANWEIPHLDRGRDRVAGRGDYRDVFRCRQSVIVPACNVTVNIGFDRGRAAIVADSECHLHRVPSSNVFRQAVSLSKDQRIVFSGSFLPGDTDCVQETSLTQEGSMSDPEFQFLFYGREGTMR